MSRDAHPPGEPFRSFCVGCDKETEVWHIPEARAVWCQNCWREWLEQNASPRDEGLA
jgi:hypothetical protein